MRTSRACRSSSLASSFVSTNLSLFGFENSASSLFQIVKELVDNGVDALQQLSYDESDSFQCGKSIQVTISEHMRLQKNEWEKMIRIDVFDNGIGMKDPKNSLLCFSTSNNNNNDGEDDTGKYDKRDNSKEDMDHCKQYSAGRFGIGLSAIMIYSIKLTGIPFCVCTKTSACKTMHKSYFVLSENGNPRLLQQLEADYDESSAVTGTQISTFVPDMDTTTLRIAIRKIKRYLLQLHLFPQNQVTFTLRVAMPAMEEVQVRDSDGVCLLLKPMLPQHRSPLSRHIPLPYYNEYAKELLSRLENIDSRRSTSASHEYIATSTRASLSQQANTNSKGLINSSGATNTAAPARNESIDESGMWFASEDLHDDHVHDEDEVSLLVRDVSIRVSAILVREDELEEHRKPPVDENQQISLHVLRYVNASPVDTCDIVETAPSGGVKEDVDDLHLSSTTCIDEKCSLSVAILQQVKWKQFGLKLQRREQADARSTVQQQPCDGFEGDTSHDAVLGIMSDTIYHRKNDDDDDDDDDNNDYEEEEEEEEEEEDSTQDLCMDEESDDDFTTYHRHRDTGSDNHRGDSQNEDTWEGLIRDDTLDTYTKDVEGLHIRLATHDYDLLFPPSQFQLVKMKETSVDQPDHTFSALVLMIDYQHKVPPYSDLKKSRLTLDANTIKRIAKYTQKTIKTLKTNEKVESSFLFSNKKEFMQRYLIPKQCIPNMARHVASIMINTFTTVEMNAFVQDLEEHSIGDDTSNGSLDVEEEEGSVDSALFESVMSEEQSEEK